MTTRRVVQRMGDLALTVGALLGLLCVMMLLAGAVGGLRPVIVLSGSMAPAIPAGSLAVAHPVQAADLRIGDVVTVTAGEKLVTHRIVAVARHAGSASLLLKGDDNVRPDEQPYEVRAAPRVVGSVPGVGRVVAWLSRTPGVFVLAGYAALLLTIASGRSGAAREGDPPGGTSPPSPRRRHVARRGLHSGPRVSSRSPRWRVWGWGLAVVVGLGGVSAAPAEAAFGDSVAVSGSTVGTYTVPAPATFTCGTLGVRSVTFNWTAVAGATNYTLYYGTGGAQSKTVTGTSTSVTTTISNGTAWVMANRNFGSTTWVSAPSVSRTYTVAVVSLCS